MKNINISFEAKPDMALDLENLARDEFSSKSAVIRKAISKALAHHAAELAMEKFNENNQTTKGDK